MSDRLSTEDGKLLLYLCRTGRLYDVEKWIADRKSLRVPPECKKSALQVSLETGFYSLVELIARHECDQATKDATLGYAVDRALFDYVQLLLANGANLNSVPLARVLYSWDPKLIRFFLANGADVITDAPFARAFGAKIRTAIRPFLEYKSQHSELAAQLQEQADRALRHFCKEGNLKWVSLLLWAGANPRSKGPSLEERHIDDSEWFTTAMEVACYAESAQILKKLKPDPDRDNLTTLLQCAALLARQTTVVYLLGLGANPNDKENGGSSALDSSLSHLSFESFSPYRHQRSRYQVAQTLGCVQVLVEHGAKWTPDDRHHMAWVRRALYECEPAVTIELLQILTKHSACSRGTIEELLRPARMKQHLESQRWHLARLKLTPEKSKKKKELSVPELLAQYDRQELYQKIWSEPTRTVAKQYGVSDVWLGKVCRALRIPVPGRGYWAKKYAGARVRTRPALQPIAKAIPNTVR